MTATATWPTLRGFAAYVAGAIDSASGRREQAEEHYARAIDLARSSGATFLDGIATVGLLTQRVDAGRIDDALGGYRDVIDYFARTGNWTHQWTTLRNLAHLLRQLGDHEPATLLDAAADQAPDAPAIGPTPTPTATKAPPSPPPSPTATPSHQPSTRPRGGPGGDRAEPARAITRSLPRAIPPVVERPSLWKWLQ